jgi:hypothetical protein
LFASNTCIFSVLISIIGFISNVFHLMSCTCYRLFEFAYYGLNCLDNFGSLTFCKPPIGELINIWGKGSACQDNCKRQTSDACVNIDIRNSDRSKIGFWAAVTCNTTLSFVCEYHYATPTPGTCTGTKRRTCVETTTTIPITEVPVEPGPVPPPLPNQALSCNASGFIQQKIKPDGCSYLKSYSAQPIALGMTQDIAIAQCLDKCAADVRCNFAYILYISLGHGAWNCLLSEPLFNSSFLSCGYSDYVYQASGFSKTLPNHILFQPIPKECGREVNFYDISFPRDSCYYDQYFEGGGNVQLLIATNEVDAHIQCVNARCGTDNNCKFALYYFTPDERGWYCATSPELYDSAHVVCRSPDYSMSKGFNKWDGFNIPVEG